MEERDLEVDEVLVRRKRHRPHGAAHVLVARLAELLPHVELLEHLVRVAVDDLEDPLAFGRVHRWLVGRRVHGADRGVVDAVAVA